MWAVQLSTTPTRQPDRRSGQVILARADTMKGRILIDVPAHGLKCGEYVDLSEELGKQLLAEGCFDPHAHFQGSEQDIHSEPVQMTEKIVKRRKSS